MIDYVEVRDKTTKVIGIIDTAQSVIWHSVYFGVGDFEIYVSANAKNIDLLQEGRYITRPDNEEVGIIASVKISTYPEDGIMILAKGRFFKSVLDRRLIYQLAGNTNTATILSGNVEFAVRKVVKDNAIDCPFDSKRNMSKLALGSVSNIPAVIVDINGNPAQKQVSYQNLLTYTDGVLEEYGTAAKCILMNGMFNYVIYSGADRTVGNAQGNFPVVFSREFDNLINNEYSKDTTEYKNVALIGGEGEGLERFYSLVDSGAADLNRREMWVDASSISKTYKDENDEEKTYTDAEYKQMLDAMGAQDLALYTAVESFSGILDVTNGNYVFGRDFALGDIITLQDNHIKKYANVRISEVTEVQDGDGYTVEVSYK